MAITIDWLTKEILVPKADMLLVQTNPLEVRQLNINDFHDTLRDIEDNTDGIVFSHTHNYKQPTLVSGVTLALVLELLEPYTVTFEDGLYNVNIVGGNSNISDRVNKNQVGVNTANSAGLQDSTSLQAASFADVVALDQINGTDGTTFPIGTKGTPVKTIADARIIMEKNNIGTVYIVGHATFDTGDDISHLTVKGQNPTKTVITLNDGASTTGCEIHESTVFGILDGGTILRNCLVYSINYFNGFLVDCVLGEGTIALDGGTSALFLRCVSGVAGAGTPIIDMGGSGQSLGVRDYAGGLTIINRTGSEPISMDFSSGQVIFDETVTNNDNIFVRGLARLTDRSTGVHKIDSVGLLSGERTVRGSGRVVVDTTGYSGIDARNGTDAFPVNNVTDAILIAKINDVKNIHIVNTVSTTGTEDLSGYIICGESPVTSSIIITAGTTTTNTTFREINLSGALSSDGAVVERCMVGTVTGMQSFFYSCFFYGTVTLSGNTTCALCSIAPTAPMQMAHFHFDNLASTLIVSDWGAGIVMIDEMITGSFAGISGVGGRIQVGANNTGGTLVHGGNISAIQENLETLDEIRDHTGAGTVIAAGMATKKDVIQAQFIN